MEKDTATHTDSPVSHAETKTTGKRVKKKMNPQAPPPEPLLTVKQVSKWLNCSRHLVISMASDGRLPCVNISRSAEYRCFRFRRSDVEAFVATSYVPPKKFEFHEVTRNGKPVNVAHEIAVQKLRQRGFKI